jgi:hypothetical protein
LAASTDKEIVHWLAIKPSFATSAFSRWPDVTSPIGYVRKCGIMAQTPQDIFEGSAI